jgi:hypothetical protein
MQHTCARLPILCLVRGSGGSACLVVNVTVAHPGVGCVSCQIVGGRLTSHRDTASYTEPADSQCPMKPRVFCKLYVFTLSLLSRMAFAQISDRLHRSSLATLRLRPAGESAFSLKSFWRGVCDRDLVRWIWIGGGHVSRGQLERIESGGLRGGFEYRVRRTRDLHSCRGLVGKQQ